MNLPRFVLTHRSIIYVFAFVLVAWGAIVYQTAPRKEDPEFIIRDGFLLTIWPGATVEQVEKLVSDPIEQILEGVKTVRRVESTNYAGASVIQITLKDAIIDANPSWDKIRAELRLVQPKLPLGCLPPLLNDNFSQATVMNLCLFQDPEAAQKRPYTPRELEDFARRLRDGIMDLRPMIAAQGNHPATPDSTAPAFVERVTLYGVQQEAIYIETDMGRWSQLALTPEQLTALLVARNIVTPAGEIETQNTRYDVQMSGQFSVVEQINKAVVGRVAVGPGQEKITLPLAVALQVAGRETKKIGPIPLPITQNVPVMLQDLDLKVSRTYRDPPAGLTRFSNAQHTSPCIVISFSMKPGVNVVELNDAVETLLANASERMLPPDIQIVKTADQPLAVDKKVREVSSNVVSSIAVVILVLVLMGGIRMSVIAAIAIPLIMLITVGLMRIWDVALEQVSLSALIVALGMLVDSTIQVCDNTQKYLNRGASPFEAATKGVAEIAFPVLIAAGTVIASFYPMTFSLTGGMKEALFSLPVVVCLAMVVGWIFAVSMTTIMAYKLLRPNVGGNPAGRIWRAISSRFPRRKRVGKREGRGGRSGGVYSTLCLATIKFRWPAIAGSFFLLYLATMLPISPSFFPPAVRNQFVVEVCLPEGTPVERTSAVMQRVEQTLRSLNNKTYIDGRLAEMATGQERLMNMCSFVGLGGPFNYAGLYPKPDSSNFGIIWVNTNDEDDVPQYVADIRRAVAEGIGEPGADNYVSPVVGARVIPQRLIAGYPVASPIEIRVLGPRLGSERVLRKFGNRIKDAIRHTGMAWDIHDSWGEHRLQVDVDIEQEKANLAGVTNASIARSMNAFYRGQRLTTLREGDRQIPVILRLTSAQRKSLQNIDDIYVQGLTGKVPINSIARVGRSWQPGKITRYKRERNFGVRCRPEAGLLYSQVLDAIQPQLDEIGAELPAGYRLEFGGTKEEADKGTRLTLRSLTTSLVLIYILLVVQFNSVVKPFIILLTVPLATIGGLLGLYLMGLPLGFTELLGFLALFGIVLGAAILLMDFSQRIIAGKLASPENIATTDEKSCSGLKGDIFRRSIAQAGEERLMPIMMTTLTTVGGLLSLMFAGGPMFEGMATVIVVGLILGTAFTLFVLPALIAVFVEDFGLNLVPVSQSPASSATE